MAMELVAVAPRSKPNFLLGGAGGFDADTDFDTDTDFDFDTDYDFDTDTDIDFG